MINTVSDLLLELKNKEVELLEKFDIIKHPGIIGSMYEGLTLNLLNQSLFENLDLRVCGGKIKNSNNEYSDEIDCMIVMGEGIPIPYTDKYIYDSKNVIVVIQVKKNLFSKDIRDSYENLESVIKTTEFRDGEKYHGVMHRDAFRGICQEEIPLREDLHLLSKPKQMIYHTLLLEAFYPVRIVWGYNGFKSEFALRQAFFNYLEENLSPENKQRSKFSPLKLPSLIICDKFSLIKSNGIPFYIPLDSNGWWALLSSSPENPIYLLLQVIWTRIQYMFGLSAKIFGDDDFIQNEMRGFLLCRYKDTPELKGWEYYHLNLTKGQLSDPIKNVVWEPSFINAEQLIVIARLIAEEYIMYEEDKALNKRLTTEGISLNAFIDTLVETGLISAANGKLELITVKCICIQLPDGRICAGEDKNGRVSEWARRFMENWNANRKS